MLRPASSWPWGATAAQTLMGRAFRVTKQRSQVLDLPPASRFVATVHPSSTLRAPSAEDRALGFDGLVADLRVVAAQLAG